MNIDLDKLLQKKAFIKMIATKLGIETETLRNYFLTNRVPKKYEDFINKSYDLQLKADRRYIKDVQVNVYERI